MSRIVLVAGHGGNPFDPGAVGNGTQEAVETRRIVNALAARIRGAIVYPVARNLFATRDWNFFQTGDIVVEIHLNAFSDPSANGAEVLIRTGFNPDARNRAIASALGRWFRLRGSQGIVHRNNLQNMNQFASRGIWYCLPEICFITNSSDMRIYNTNFNAIMDDLARAIGGNNSIQPQPIPAPQPTPQPAPATNRTHTVRAGETLGGIANQHRTTVAELQRLNNIANVIRVGQVLRLPSVALPSVGYSTHVQNIGWQSTVRDGATAGTTGRSLQVEALRVALANVASGGVRIRSHVQGIGWLGWVTNNAVSGTTGQSRRVEAVQIELTGAITSQFHIEYRVHVQGLGWLPWVRNGAQAGTTGQSRRVEAIQIRLVAR